MEKDDRAAVKKLNALIIAKRILKYPNTPVNLINYKPKPFKVNTTNGLTAAIIAHLKANGHQAERISTAGRVIDNSIIVSDCLGHKRKVGSSSYIPSTGTKGSADISATIKINGIGRSVKIEVKNAATHDRQSDVQKVYQKAIEDAGGTYTIARTFSGFVNWYENFVFTA